jgi:hypothetical protein
MFFIFGSFLKDCCFTIIAFRLSKHDMLAMSHFSVSRKAKSLRKQPYFFMFMYFIFFHDSKKEGKWA